MYFFVIIKAYFFFVVSLAFPLVLSKQWVTFSSRNARGTELNTRKKRGKICDTQKRQMSRLAKLVELGRVEN